MPLLSSISNLFSHFNTLDYAFIGILVVAMLIGGFKGFCRQIVSWFFWILAGYVAYNYSTHLADHFLSGRLSSPILRLLIVNFGLVVSAFVFSFLFNRIMQSLLSVTGLSVFDRFLGVYFGMVQGVVMIAIVVTGFSATSLKQEPWWRHSRVVVMTSALMPIYAEDMVKLIDSTLSGLHVFWMKTAGEQFKWQFDSTQ